MQAMGIEPAFPDGSPQVVHPTKPSYAGRKSGD